MSDNRFTVHHSRIPFQQSLAGNAIHLWRRLHLQKMVLSGALGLAEFLHEPSPSRITTNTLLFSFFCEEGGEGRGAPGSLRAPPLPAAVWERQRCPSCEKGKATLLLAAYIAFEM